MKIIDLINKNDKFISLEFFPPKDKEAWPAFFYEVGKLSSLDPLFVSVTYGAGGGTQLHTLEIVRRLKSDYAFEPMAHLTCVGAKPENIREFLDELVGSNIDNVLALRGDPPRGETTFKADNPDFRYASDLAAFISRNYPGLGIGVAAYPETHPEAESPGKDLECLKLKLDSGGQFAITQLFFDVGIYFSFVERARNAGINTPIIPGVMPILNLAAAKRILGLCGASIPGDYIAELEKAQENHGPEAVRKLGTAYAAEQTRALLAGGAPGVHLYTLNKAEACLEIVRKAL